MIGGHDLPWFWLYHLDVLYRVLSIFEMVQGLANQWANNVCQLLGHPICDGSHTGNNRPKGVSTLCILGRP